MIGSADSAPAEDLAARIAEHSGDDPLARQSVIEEAAEEAMKASGRSTAGKAGQRGGNKRSKRHR